ncbi:T9SS type A sorting domain-containing protein [Hymenobacter convexus]|uniref:T9SS type A sorting domain-containing protein n=1 Tax=Hymenobacter sp. CA1UV-4 TaxID=3063782 RepID=UPI002712B5E9|nr:T9SS type A sorting domain-containing protein [Hymenobacter sp. CA1UV-4]MDO7853218.1 T9SS type A sorting domain-containing protein [Hymenobacter sp. CA1UV-4]
MKHHYRWLRPLLAASLLTLGFGARAQQLWRPFRPGLIYAYESPTATPAGMYVTKGIYTLRLDSAYVTAAGDSAWAFNRVMRETQGRTPGESYTNRFRKSRNNLFGQRLLWEPGSSEFTLETITEGTAQIGNTLRLRPRAPVASTWVANSALGINATLSSRGLQMVNGQADTVATITLSSGPVVRLSRRFGLIEGPQWLALSNSPGQWTATQLPVALPQSPYSPLRLFDLQPGDELGYTDDPIAITPFSCSLGQILRKVLTKTQTSDSLVYTYLEQSKYTYSGAPGCGPAAGTQNSSIATRRWALALRTGQSNQFQFMPLLTGEYRLTASGITLSLGVVQLQPGGGGCVGDQRLVYDNLYTYGANNGTFGHVPDLYTQVHFSSALGLGPIGNNSVFLTYYRRTRSGVTTTCGSPSTFVNLLPSRAAQAAALATLHPNPAAEAATLTLAQPARAGQTLRLTDALGRAVWQASVAAGQTALTVPLAEQPAGLYLLHLSGSNGSKATWKLIHE